MLMVDYIEEKLFVENSLYMNINAYSGEDNQDGMFLIGYKKTYIRIYRWNKQFEDR